MDDSGLIVDADSCFGSAVLLSSAELASGPITPPAAAPVPARPPPPHHAAVVSPSPARLTTESLLQSSSGAEADGREPLKSLLAASPSAGTSRPSFPPALLGAYDPLPRLPQPPITPSSPSPTFPASSSWTTPLSSSLCSLSSLSGPSSPGGSGTGPDLDERGGAAQGGQASRSAAASSDEGDGTDLSADSIEALDPRSSNGDLILPTLPSIAASDSLESTLRPFPGAQQQSLGPSPALIRRRVRLALVGAEEGGRGWLVGRLGEVLGLDGFSGWRTGEAGELLGFLPALTAGKEGDEGEGIELVMTLHPVKPASTAHLADLIKRLHIPLLAQLAPLEGGLMVEDLVELAMTGKGRGPAGWVDCVIVLVDSERTQETLISATNLSYLAPTVLLALPSLELPPPSSHSSHDIGTPPPFIDLMAAEPAAATRPYPTLSLLELEPLRALLLGEGGRASLAQSAGSGFGRHLASLLVAQDDDDDDGQHMDGETDEDLSSSMAASLYAFLPPPSAGSRTSHSPSSGRSACRPNWLAGLTADHGEGASFDPLFLPATVRALAGQFASSTAWPMTSSSLVILGAAAAAAAGLVVWSWLAFLRQPTTMNPTSAWPTFVTRIVSFVSC